MEWDGLRANCLHEAVHVAIAKRSKLVVTSADVTKKPGEKMVEGVELGPCKKTDELALFYFASSVYDRETLGINRVFVEISSSKDFEHFEALVVTLGYSVETARSHFTVRARRELEEPLMEKAIQLYADALEKYKRLEQPEIDRIWDEIIA